MASTVRLQSGAQIVARLITAVTEVRGGKDIAVWLTRRFGLDGKREESTEKRTTIRGGEASPWRTNFD